MLLQKTENKGAKPSPEWQSAKSISPSPNDVFSQKLLSCKIYPLRSLTSVFDSSFTRSDFVLHAKCSLTRGLRNKLQGQTREFSNIHAQVLSSLTRKTRRYCYVFSHRSTLFLFMECQITQLLEFPAIRS